MNKYKFIALSILFLGIFTFLLHSNVFASTVINADEADLSITEDVVVSDINTETTLSAEFSTTTLDETSTQGIELADESEDVVPVTTDSLEPELTTTSEAEEILSSPESSTDTVDQNLAAPIFSPILSTGKDEYHPGETASIFGKFFQSLQNIVLKIFGADRYGGDYTEETQNITADEEGSFSTTYSLDDIFRPFYDVTATDLAGNLLAKMSFLDGSTNFDQCANDNGTAGNCDWIGSILQANNSTYYEGMSVPQRIFFQGVSNGSHTVTFNYTYTKGGVHAYDFITSENQGNADFVPGITSFAACGGLSGGSATTCNTLRSASPTLVTVPNDPFDSKDSTPAAGTGSSQTTKEIAYETEFGTRNISIYKTAGATLTPALTPIVITHDVSANSDTGDSDAQVTLSFSLAGCPGNQGGSCDILIYFDGHLANGGSDNTTGSNWGSGLGSSAINGGPYHIKNLKLDGSGGSQDNQIQGSNILVQNTASITIIKDAVPNNAQDFSFTATGGLAPATFSLDDDANGTLSNTQIFSSLAPGTYGVSEGIVSGWTQTSAICSDGSPVGAISLQAGENVTCTFTNTLQTGHLVVQKTTLPASDPTVFSINTSGTGTITGGGAGTITDSSDKVYEVAVGTYSVAETVPSGWTKTGDTCQNVSVLAGATSTCVITNTKDATLKLVKTVINDNGGNATQNDFQGKIDGNNVSWDTAGVVGAGAHIASETNLSGYVAGSWGGDCASDGSVTLNPGDAKICTITNNDNPAKIILNKVVVNDNGGTAGINDFGLTVGGASVFSGATTTVNSNSPIALNEAGLSGYSFVSITGDQKCPQVLGGTVTLDEGETVVCNITNDDQPAHIIVVKHVDNGNTGATTSASAFTINISGTAGSASFAGAENPGVNTQVNAGTFSVSENPVAGYAPSTTGDCSGSIALGETKTCTITNTAISPTLKLIKTVINDNGGTKQVSDFPLFIDANGVSSEATTTVTIGSHIASEISSLGYAASAWGGDCEVDGDVTLQLGENKTCTITNDDIAPKLTVTKVVINDNGGTKEASEFPLSVSSTTVLSGIQNGFNVGSYVVSEITDSGYTSTITGDCDINGNVTLGLADIKSCTITNNDIAPTLTLIKTVVNDNGGTATTTDFQGKIDGNNVSWGAENILVAGAHTASETNLSGYTAGVWGGNCAADGSVTLAVGETKTCTITNDDQVAKLIVIKHVINHGGSAVAGDFTMNVTATAPSDDSFPGAENPGTEITLDAGTYGVGESLNNNYTKTIGANCSGTIANGETKTCTITNEEKTAKLTIVKDATPNDLIDFSFNGGQVLGAFLLDDDQGVQDIGLNGDVNRDQSKVFVGINTGSYTVTETEPNQFWTLSEATCVNTVNSSVYSSSLVGNSLTINLTPGSDVTCTFKNHKDSPTRTQGFWQTHTTYTTSVFNSIIGGMNIGSAPHKGLITTPGQLFGAFFSSIPKKTNNQQRTVLDKARMQLLQQLVAAKLNCAAFGCSSGVQTMINNADTAFAGTSASAILTSAGQMDAYNNSGDTIIIGNAGSATPKTSQNLANKAFWDLP